MTLELDHIVAAVFGLWDVVIDERRRFSQDPQLSLLLKPVKKAGEARARRTKLKAAGGPTR